MKKLLVLALLGVAATLSACADTPAAAPPVATVAPAAAPMAAPAAVSTKKVVKPSKAVSKAQTALKAAGFDPGAIDGVIGKKTRAAVSAFQKAKSLPVTGKFDKATKAALKV